MIETQDKANLINEFKAGSMQAFDRIVNLYRKQVFQTAYHFTGCYEDADDISQEVFIQAYRSIGKLKENSKFSTWLQRITINISINYLRKNSRHQNNETCTDEMTYLESFSTNIDPLFDMESKELTIEIRNAIVSLPVTERAVFILKAYQDLSYKEIAQVLKCPEGTVMSRLNRARRMLRDKLKDYVF